MNDNIDFTPATIYAISRKPDVIQFLDPSNGQVRATHDLPFSCIKALAYPILNTVYLIGGDASEAEGSSPSASGKGHVAFIDATNGAEKLSFETEKQPLNIQLDSQRNLLYVSYKDSDKIDAFDALSGVLLKTIELDFSSPEQFVIDSSANLAYCYGDPVDGPSGTNFAWLPVYSIDLHGGRTALLEYFKSFSNTPKLAMNTRERRLYVLVSFTKGYLDLNAIRGTNLPDDIYSRWLINVRDAIYDPINDWVIAFVPGQNIIVALNSDLTKELWHMTTPYSPILSGYDPVAKKLYCASGSYDTSNVGISCVDLETREATWSTTLPKYLTSVTFAPDLS